MHHTMADSNRQASNLGAQEFHDLGQRRRHIGNVNTGPGLVDQRLAFHALGEEPRTDADAFDLAF